MLDVRNFGVSSCSSIHRIDKANEKRRARYEKQCCFCQLVNELTELID